MKYDTSPVAEIVRDPSQFKRIYKLASAWSTRLEWGLDDYELSNIARRFIRYIEEGKYFSAAVILEFLEDINYHTEYGEFLGGDADKYILSN